MPEITLRLLCDRDRERIVDILTDDTVKQTYMLPDFDTREGAYPLFQRLMTLSADENRYVRCIAKDNTAVGFINDVEIKDGKIELGYAVHPDSQGYGYMTLALKAAIAELLRIGYKTIVCGAFSQNAASMRVMEKAGMDKIEFTEMIDYREKDHLCIYYAINKENNHAEIPLSDTGSR